MRIVASLILVTTLCACSKQAPAPPVAQLEQNASEVSAPVQAASSAPEVPPAPAPVPDGPPAAGTTPDGAALFASTCATCHMADGSGVPFLQPSIKGSAWISNPDPQLLLSLILRGSVVLGEAAKAYDNDMAPQEHLTDAEIAALATHVRTRFAAEPLVQSVTPAQVALARARPGLPE